MEFVFERPLEAIGGLTADPVSAMRILYTRTNPKGLSEELWRHAYGCRAWLVVVRNTASNAVLTVRPYGADT